MTEQQIYSALLIILACGAVYQVIKFIRAAKKALRAERKGRK